MSTGGVSSNARNILEACVVFPHASVAVHVIVRMRSQPSPMSEWSELICTIPVQLSVAFTSKSEPTGSEPQGNETPSGTFDNSGAI